MSIGKSTANVIFSLKFGTVYFDQTLIISYWNDSYWNHEACYQIKIYNKSAEIN